MKLNLRYSQDLKFANKSIKMSFTMSIAQKRKEIKLNQMLKRKKKKRLEHCFNDGV